MPGTQVPWQPSGWTGPDWELGSQDVDGAFQIPKGAGVTSAFLNLAMTVGESHNWGVIGAYDPTTATYKSLSAFDECETSVRMLYVANINEASTDLTITWSATTVEADYLTVPEVVAQPDAYEAAAALAGSMVAVAAFVTAF